VYIVLLYKQEKLLDCIAYCFTMLPMATKQPTPGKRTRKQGKDFQLNLRVSGAEKAAFDRAAEICGTSLSSWIRERLRAASLRDLDTAGELAPFLAAPTTKKATHG
jgi:hypothetical protein